MSQSSHKQNIGLKKNNQAKTPQQFHYAGPLPPSNELRNYGNIDSSFPDRIVAMSEKQMKHRQELESKSAEVSSKNSKSNRITTLLGLIFGFIIVMFALTLALIMILKGQYWNGVFAIFGIIGAIAIAWSKSNKSNK
ncbi:DUF2335 domain-containing protein [Convivina intestini]|uniref:Putative membrane protein n=1 Tax=Convivina intestini TaxID=1505726 RepID=A0A2U1DG30_9LACO|nr:DUF2335 domain-containing protein [Convivina intestini]PVY86522.1 putative membrane protein [Convivina intestini]CAH1857492.1 hypothetical protein R077811_01532 [Convivina intestini]SDC13473.1 Uncharacterized membrane protein [Leuconostocaceae bacterium R-53105]